MSQVERPLDIEPRRSTASRLMGLINELNAAAEKTNTKLKSLQEQLEREHAAHEDLQIRYARILDMYLCERCQLKVASTPKGRTIVVCSSCQETNKEVSTLKTENRQLRKAVQKHKENYEELWDRYCESGLCD